MRTITRGPLSIGTLHRASPPCATILNPRRFSRKRKEEYRFEGTDGNAIDAGRLARFSRQEVTGNFFPPPRALYELVTGLLIIFDNMATEKADGGQAKSITFVHFSPLLRSMEADERKERRKGSRRRASRPTTRGLDDETAPTTEIQLKRTNRPYVELVHPRDRVRRAEGGTRRALTLTIDLGIGRT